MIGLPDGLAFQILNVISNGKYDLICDQFFIHQLQYKLFGVNAELLIDHAWGWEPTTIADIKAYKPESNSIGSGPANQQLPVHNPVVQRQRRLDDLPCGRRVLSDIFRPVGLSWECVLNKRERFRTVYDSFDVEKVSRYGEEKIAELLSDPGIIRNLRQPSGFRFLLRLFSGIICKKVQLLHLFRLKGESVRKSYHGEITIDRYGRSVPKHAHGTENIGE